MNRSLQGVMAIYNRAEYVDERTVALQKWTDELERIVSATP